MRPGQPPIGEFFTHSSECVVADGALPGLWPERSAGRVTKCACWISRRIRSPELAAEFDAFGPGAVGFGLNYLANVPEVVDITKWMKARAPALLEAFPDGGASGTPV
jgi:hypothetical protein